MNGLPARPANNYIVGSMMIEGEGNSQKVITLPKEESYGNTGKAARQSEYIARQGREALEKLAQHGLSPNT